MGGGVALLRAAEALKRARTQNDDRKTDSVRKALSAARKNGWANIPSRSNRKQRFAFSGWLYRQRNLVQRFFNRIKHFRGIATRYDKTARNFLAAIQLAAAVVWLN